MLSPKTKRNISRIIPFGLIWFSFAVIYLLIEQGLLGDLEFYPTTGNKYHFNLLTLIVLGFATLMGLILGTVEILYMSKRFKETSLTKKMIFKTSIYGSMIISFLVLISTIITVIDRQTTIFDLGVWATTWNFISSMAFWSVELYIAAIIIVSLFYSEVSDNMGHEVLRNFLSGRYHRPIQEERIFMFLDMKSSTTIAEKLGHVKYFEMLAEYYADMSDAIIHYEGEIYQYVGDEIVVSWKPHKGAYNDNCINCFYAMKDALEQNSRTYMNKYGVLPTFKAGFHVGKVTTGEIGVLKKDIIFTGDVLNTTARIQALCNDREVNILVSDELVQTIGLGLSYETHALGETSLRGRDETVELFTIKRT